MQNYILTELLGEGYNAIVYKGFSNNSQEQYVAIKRCKNSNTIANQNALENEAQLLSELDHPNIVSLKQFNQEEMFLVQELAEEGELFNYVKLGAFNENIARTLFHQLIDGISYCHSKCIAHRDIKLENLLLDRNFVLKIADFGFAAKPDFEGLHKGIFGTKGYISPEILQNIPYKGELSDVFACGVVLFMLYIGNAPFTTAEIENNLYKLIINNQIEKFWKLHLYHKPEKANIQFQDLINKMLAYSPDDRITIKDIKTHPWFVGTIASQEIIIEEFQARKLSIQ